MTALSGQCRRLMKIIRNFILLLTFNMTCGVMCDVSWCCVMVMCSVVYWSMVVLVCDGGQGQGQWS